MRKHYAKRAIALFMSFLMALSVLFQSDFAIRGIEVYASDGQTMATPTDSGGDEYIEDDVASLADTGTIDLDSGEYEIYLGANGGLSSYKDGAEVKPTIYVKKKTDVNVTSPLSSSLYTVTYSNNKEVGTATVTVTGNSDKGCVGTLTADFTIQPKRITSTAQIFLDGKENENKYSLNSDKYYTYTAGGVCPDIYVKTSTSSTGKFLTRNVDYTVYYKYVDSACTLNKDPNYGTCAVIKSKNPNYIIGKAADNDQLYVYFGINEAKMADQRVVVVGSTQVYTGDDIKPEVLVYDAQTGDLLSGPDSSDPEYELKYTNVKNVGTGTITVKGKSGKYSGSQDVTFTIVPAGTVTKDLKNAKVTFDGEYTYNGQAQKPVPVVTYDGKKLVEGTDYENVGNYSNNIKASTNNSKATVTLTGKGEYSGSIVASFVIKPRSIENVSYTVTDAQYLPSSDPTNWSGVSVTVKDEAIGQTLVSNNNFAEYTLDFSEFEAKKNCAVGTYSFNIVGCANYTGTKKGEFKIVPANLSSAQITIDPVEYTGSPVEPDKITVKMNNVELKEGTDYTITGYSNNTELGSSAQVTIAGMGNFTGTKIGNFTIQSTSKKSVSDLTVSTVTQAVYTGDQIKPAVTVKDGEDLLTEGKDYTLSFGTNVTPKDGGTVVVKGMGDYVGSKTLSFTIRKKSISDNDVKCVYTKSYEYTGKNIDIEVTLTYNNKVLKKGVDYVIRNTVKDVTGDDPVRIVVNADQSDCFMDSVFLYVTVTSPTGNMDSLTYGEIEDQTYTGQEICPVLNITNGSYSLKEGIDYEVTSRTDNINVGKSTLIIKGKGSYDGEKTLEFNIIPKQITDCPVNTIGKYTYAMGKAICPAVTLKNGNVELAQGKDYSVTFENNVNVTGDEKARIIIKALSSNYEGSRELYFDIIPLTISRSSNGFSMTDATSSVEYTGSPIKPVIVVKRNGQTLVQGEEYEVAYGTNTSVGDTGSVTVTGIGNFDGTVEMNFNITKKSITESMIEDIAKQLYTGKEVTPEVTVKHGDLVLVEGEDYSVAYKNNTDEGEATVTVTGMGTCYTGSASKKFTISREYIDINNDKLEVKGLGNQTYNFGVNITPAFTVWYDGKQLTEKTEYTYSFSNNVNCGTAVLGIIGAGIYGGKKTFNFTIEPYDITGAKAEAEDVTYTGSAQTPKVTVTLANGKIVPETAYDVTYESNTEVGTAKITVKAKADSNYTGMATGSFNIKEGVKLVDISDAKIASIENQKYTGSQICPQLSVSVNGRILVYEKDYVIDKYIDNIAAGKASVVIKGIGIFTGTCKAEFVIEPKSVEECTVSEIGSQIYTGKEITPEVTVKDGEVVLTAGVDYSVKYQNNNNVTSEQSPAIVVITGKGNYSGEISRTFAITAKNIARCSVDPIGGQTYTGKPVTPDVVVRDGDTVLVKDKDYTVEYSNNTEITDKDKAVVTVTGKGNYKGVISAEFTIAKEVIDISKAQISKPDDQYYDFGNPIKPDVTVTYNGKELVKDTDYELIYTGNSKEGTAKIQAVGINSNIGQVSTTFEILPIDIAKATVTLEKDTYEYTGKEFKPAVKAVAVNRAGKVQTVTSLDAFEVVYASNINAGTAKVTLNAIKGSGFTGTANGTFAITAKNIGDCNIDSVNGQIYTGKEIKPAVTVRDGATVLVADQDYTVAYSNNVNVTTADKQAVITITGKGNYTGSKTVNFAISKKVTDISKAVIAKIADQYYDFGQPVTPAVSVTLNGTALENGRDYELSYKNNIGEGTAEVTVTGINSNTGSVTAKFNIRPVDISSGVITLDASEYVFSGSPLRPEIDSFKVTRQDKTVEVTDFSKLEITYSANTKVGTGKITISALAGEGFTGSVSKTFKITGASLENAEVKIEDGIYTGEEVKPSYTVTLDGRTLAEGKDYTAAFRNNINASNSAELTITGINNYTGDKACSFTINPRKITEAGIDVASAKYTGQKLQPSVTVTLAGKILVQDVDFTAEYGNNVDVTANGSKAYVKITGKGNYAGTATEEFEIAPRDISLVEIKDVAAQTYTGNQIKPEVILTDGAVTLRSGKDYTVSYSNNTNVTDNAEIIITGKGNYTGSVSRTFAISGADINAAVITGVKDKVTYTGSDIVFSGLKVMYGDELLVADRDYSVVYSGNRNVTDKAEVKISGKGNYSGTVTKTFVIEKKDISDPDCYISEIGGQKYTGTEIEPEIVVTCGSTTLREDVDYEVTYSNNIEESAAGSPAKATVTGKGSYTGTVIREFTITKDPIKITSAEIDTIADQEFAKAYITPEVTVRCDGKVLTEGTDYKVLCVDNYNVGTAKVYITGYGSYTGTKSTTFRILKKDITGYVAVLEKTELTYTGKKQTPAVVSIHNSDGSFVIGAEEIDDFTVSYKANIAAGQAEVTATAGSISNYTGSVTAEFKIAPAALENVEISAEAAEYTGEEVTPEVTVTRNGELLTDDDYSVEYRDNIEVGTASVIINGKGNYVGSALGTFEITARSLRNCDITCSSGVEYTGKEVYPVVVVKNGAKTLEEGTDYELSYDSNTEVTSKAKVVVTGKGNYRDSVTRYFEITGRSIAGAEVSGILDKEYTGAEITQNVDVTFDGEKLVQGRDYTISYSDNIHAGTATVLITGIGNYSDTLKKNFVVNRADVSDEVTVTGISSESTYTGSEIKFNSVKIVWNEVTLKADRDYKLSYSNNINATTSQTSKASCTVNFTGDYRGKVTKQFRIKTLDISKTTVPAVKAVTYNGKVQKPTITVKLAGKDVSLENYSVTYKNNKNPGAATIVITGKKNFSGTKNVTFNILPAKVSGIACTGRSDTTINVKWKAATGVNGYKIYRTDSNGKNKVFVGSTDKTSISVKKLNAGTTYKIKVVAYKNVGNKTLLGAENTASIVTKPAALRGLKTAKRKTTSIKLSWNKVTSASGYIIYRHNGKKYVQVGRIRSNKTTCFTNTRLASGKSYKYKVTAYRISGNSRVENKGAEINSVTLPAKPRVNTKSGKKQAKVTWKKVSGADGYVLYMKTSKKGKLKKVITLTKSSKISYTKKKLKPGKTYYFAVRAYKKDSKGNKQYGAYSDTKSVKVK